LDGNEYISLNLLKSETENKVGIKIKRKMASRDNDYLLKVLEIFECDCAEDSGKFLLLMVKQYVALIIRNSRKMHSYG